MPSLFVPVPFGCLTVEPVGNKATANPKRPISEQDQEAHTKYPNTNGSLPHHATRSLFLWCVWRSKTILVSRGTASLFLCVQVQAAAYQKGVNASAGKSAAAAAAAAAGSPRAGTPSTPPVRPPLLPAGVPTAITVKNAQVTEMLVVFEKKKVLNLMGGFPCFLLFLGVLGWRGTTKVAHGRIKIL